MILLVLVSIALAATSQPARPVTPRGTEMPAHTNLDYASLIPKLASRSFPERREAMKTLRAHEREALPFLIDGSTSPDLDIRRQTRTLLEDLAFGELCRSAKELYLRFPQAVALEGKPGRIAFQRGKPVVGDGPGRMLDAIELAPSIAVASIPAERYAMTCSGDDRHGYHLRIREPPAAPAVIAAVHIAPSATQAPISVEDFLERFGRRIRVELP